jgi:predicted dehydrogenase
VRTGELGELYYLDSARLNLGLYQSDVDVVLDLAPHDISIMNFVLDSEPTAVSAWGARHAHYRHIDVAHVRLDYAPLGVTATIRVSWLDPCKVRQLTAVGSRKMIHYDGLNSEEPIRLYDKGVMPFTALDPLEHGQISYWYGDVIAPYTPRTEPLTVQDDHFVECIINDKTPQSDGWSGLAVVRVLEAIERSIQHGGWVSLLPTDVVERPHVLARA